MAIPVIHLRSTFQVGGPEKLILSGLAAMTSSEFDFTLASFQLPDRPNRFAEYAASLQIPVTTIPITSSYDRSAIERIRRLVRDSQARLLVVHDYRAVILALLARVRPRVPILAVAHGWTSQSLRVKVYEFLERFALRRVDAVAAVSRPKYDELLRIGIDKDCLELIENGVAIPPPDALTNTMALKEDLGLPADTLLIGTVGRLSPEKGHNRLIEAAARLAPLHPHLRFVLFGEGPQRGLLNGQLHAAGLEGRVFLPGWRTDMAAVYRGLDAFVLPSLTEGLPMALLEAMAYGVPCVATTVGGCPDVIVDQESGLLIPPDDIPALAQALERIIADVDVRKRLGAAGRRRVETHYSIERYAAQFLNLYRRLTGGMA